MGQISSKILNKFLNLHFAGQVEKFGQFFLIHARLSAPEGVSCRGFRGKHMNRQVR